MFLAASGVVKVVNGTNKLPNILEKSKSKYFLSLQLSRIISMIIKMK